MHDLISLPRAKQEEAVWLTAYARALRTLAPADAEQIAIDALYRFRSRWIVSEAPDGIDPRMWAALQEENARGQAADEARIASFANADAAQS